MKFLVQTSCLRALVFTVCAVLINANLNAAEPACDGVPEGLVGWWALESNGLERTGRHPGSMTGTTTFEAAKVGQGMALAGTDGGLVIPDAPELNFGPGRSFSFEAWIKANPGSTKELMSILDKRTSTNMTESLGYTLSLYYGNLVFHLGQAPASPHSFTNYHTFEPDLRDGRFHHVAVSVERAAEPSGKIFVDGRVILHFDPSGQSGDLSNSDPLRIGRHANPDLDAFFDGIIDEVALYNRALTDEEVAGIFEAGAAGKCGSLFPPEESLVAWWPAEGSANSIPEGNNGALVGGTAFGSGAIGAGFLLDGRDDHVKVNASQALDVGTGNGLTVEAWVKPSDLLAQQPVLEWNSGTAYGSHFYISVIPPHGGGPGCLFANLVDVNRLDHVITSPGDLVRPNAWQHVAVTYDKSTGKAALYLEGAVVATANLGSFTPETSFDVLLGYRPAGFGGSPFAFAGGLDEVRLYDRALPPEIIALRAKAASLPGLTAWWRFDEADGSIAHDSAGPIQGVLSSGASFVTGGISGNAVSLRRDLNGFIDMGNALDLVGTSFSVAAWIKMNAGDRTGNSLVVARHEAGINNGYFLNVNRSNTFIGQDDKASFFAGNAGAAPVSTTPVNDGRWHHLVAVHNVNGDNLLYVDGVRESAAPGEPVQASPAPFLVGGASFEGVSQGRFTGLIDELQVYARALTDEEARVLFQRGSALPAEVLWVSTAAGSGEAGNQDGAGVEARFNRPNGGFVGINLSAYIADTENHLIRRFDTSSGTTTTVAGTGVAGANDGPGATAEFNRPLGTFSDSSGTVFVADTGNNRIRRIAPGPSAEVSTYAGSGTRGYLDGPAASAQFDFPNDLVMDAAGNLFVSEFNNHTIRKVAPDGTVSTFAGNGRIGFADGVGTSAGLNQPAGLAIDRNGNLYVTEWGSHRIRRITSDGAVKTLAGTVFPGFKDGQGVEAAFNLPDGIAVDAAGMLYVTEQGNHAVRRVTASGAVTTIAGTGAAGYRDGSASTALFNAPGGIGTVADGSLVIADTGNHRLRQIRSLSAPQVLLEPASRTVTTGARVEFVPRVTGPGPYTFRWRFNGQDIPGAIGSSLTLANVQLFQSGSYSVVVSNAVGSTESSATVLTIVLPVQFERRLPTYYSPGVKMTVRLRAILPEDGVGYAHAVEDSPPAGWTVSQVSAGGTYDAATHKVKFGPFYNLVARVPAYEVIPPAHATGPQTFAGITSADGLEQPVIGADTILPPPMHPADLDPADRRMTISEITAYAAAWRRGEEWSIDPNPIPIDYLTRAAFLWKNGEQYGFNPLAEAPLWWTDAMVGIAGFAPSRGLALLSFPQPNSIVRTLPATFIPGEPFVVHLRAKPGPGVSSYAVEEQIPQGVTVSNLSDDGEFDAANRLLKWGPFFDFVERDLEYTAVSAGPGVTFAGRMSMDGTSVPTAGADESRAAFRLRSLRSLPSGELALEVGTPDGKPYTIQSSTNLQDWMILTTTTNLDGVLLFRDPELFRLPQRFYRASW